MNSVLLQALFGFGCIAIGFAAGLGVSWREYRLGPREFVGPALPRTEKQTANMLVVVALLAVVSTVYAAVSSAKQATCNRDFKQSLVARSAISTENQQHLNDMMFAVADAASHPQPDSRERVQKAILDYRAWAQTAEKRRSANPIADPRCEE